MDKIHSMRKISFALHTLPSKTLDFSTCHLITVYINPQVTNWGNFKIFFTKEASNIKHHNTISVGINYKYSNAILKPRNAFVAQQQ